MVIHPRDRADAIAGARDAPAVIGALLGALEDPAFAMHDEALMDVGAQAARRGHLGLDVVLLDLAEVASDARTAAYLVLVGYWHATARVEAAAYARLVGALRDDGSLWRGDLRPGIAALAALAALTVHADRGVAPSAASAERREVLRRVKHLSPQLATAAAHAGV